MIAALSTGHKIGLIAVAAVFITFALVSSFVLPRGKPDYPGRQIRWFVGACVVLFVAMLSAVVVFGAEPKEQRAAEATTTEQTATTTGGATTSAAAPSSGSGGDATSGKALFTSKGCGGCHSITGAFVTGPSLKGVYGSTQTLADGSTVKADVAYITQSILDPNAKVVKCANCGPPSPMASVIQPGTVSKQQAADLVAYIETLK